MNENNFKDNKINARKIIIDKISNSKDDGLNRSKHCRSKWFLRPLFIEDFFDIVLYYVSLQPDLEQIANIESDDFQIILKEVWDRRIEGINDKKITNLILAWHPDSGAAQNYFVLCPGFRQKKNMLEFFFFPIALADSPKNYPGNWPRYKKYRIEELILPKFKRIQHFKRLDFILNFAEEVCEKLREESQKKSE